MIPNIVKLDVLPSDFLDYRVISLEILAGIENSRIKCMGDHKVLFPLVQAQRELCQPIDSRHRLKRRQILEIDIDSIEVVLLYEADKFIRAV